MALIDELKEMRENAKAEREEQEVLVMAHQDSADKLGAHISDLDRAIAALEPVLADEQPELFEDASVALEQLETDHALPPSADDVVVEEAPETVEELPALNEAIQDEREQPVEDGYAPVTNPEADAWSAPVETTPGTLTEYVPPTNPDADFWARGITEQPKPEPFRLASIFRREKEDA
jgi:hypothetical protein